MAVSVVVTLQPSITLACLNHLSDWLSVIWVPSDPLIDTFTWRIYTLIFKIQYTNNTHLVYMGGGAVYICNEFVMSLL